MRKACHTVTDIVAAVYCERKMVFDRTYGKGAPLAVKAKAAAGTFEHLRFEVEGRTLGAIDKRCFIASHVYGGDAPETVFLRAWRDRVLAPSPVGRLLVRGYYALSPTALLLLSRSRRLSRLSRAVLNALLRFLGMPQ